MAVSPTRLLLTKISSPVVELIKIPFVMELDDISNPFSGRKKHLEGRAFVMSSPKEAGLKGAAGGELGEGGGEGGGAGGGLGGGLGLGGGGLGLGGGA